MDCVKVVIEIDKNDYNRIKEIPGAFDSLTSRAYRSLKEGVLLKDLLKEVLDDIRTEIHNASCFYHGSEFGDGIDLAEQILCNHIMVVQKKTGIEETDIEEKEEKEI